MSREGRRAALGSHQCNMGQEKAWARIRLLGMPAELSRSAGDKQELAGDKRGHALEPPRQDMAGTSPCAYGFDYYLHCKVLLIYRSRNHFTTETQLLALLPLVWQPWQVPSLVCKDISAEGVAAQFVLQTRSHRISGVCTKGIGKISQQAAPK